MNPQGCGPNCQSEPTVVRSPGGWALEDYLPELRRRIFCAQEGPKHTDLGGCAGAAASADGVPGYWSGRAHRQRMLTEVSIFGDERRRREAIDRSERPLPVVEAGERLLHDPDGALGRSG